MTDNERQIIANELISYGVSKFVTKFYKEEDYEEEFEVSMKGKDVLTQVFSIMQQQGRIIQLPDESLGTTVSVIKSGITTNACIAKVTIVPSGEKSKIYVYGLSLEGVIKQHAGEKLAKKIIQLIKSNCY